MLLRYAAVLISELIYPNKNKNIYILSVWKRLLSASLRNAYAIVTHVRHI